MRQYRNVDPQRATHALEVRHDDEIYRIEIKRVATARRFILRVRNATRDAVLTMPQRAALKDARDFAERHAAWVGARLRRLPESVPFVDGALIPLRGIDTRIVHNPLARGAVAQGESDGAPALHVSGDAPHIERRVRDWLKAQCRADLEDAVDFYARAIGRAAPRIALRDTTSRWGSCSSTGALSFSWRLILAPPDVLRYLAAHEVCHLVHMDHSDKFWDLCRSICPETDMGEAWLKARGVQLHRFGAT
ncbi:MAG: M48 family metallopeptidase [Hyphomicrobiales bacterium]|nr:M48 family metallopeptidase [Hyphomicrobiales bacterium]